MSKKRDATAGHSERKRKLLTTNITLAYMASDNDTRVMMESV